MFLIPVVSCHCFESVKRVNGHLPATVESRIKHECMPSESHVVTACTCRAEATSPVHLLALGVVSPLGSTLERDVAVTMPSSHVNQSGAVAQGP